MSRLDVAVLVAKKKGSAQIDIMLSGHIGDHPKAEFAARAVPSIPLYEAVRMMRAVLEPVNARAPYRELFRHPCMEFVYVASLVEPADDPRLDCDNKGQIVGDR